MPETKKKKNLVLKDLYPDHDIVGKVNYHGDWQGSYICEDLAEDRVSIQDILFPQI